MTGSFIVGSNQQPFLDTLLTNNHDLFEDPMFPRTGKLHYHLYEITL